MKQRKKQIGARYVAKVRGAFHRVIKLPRPQRERSMCPECGSDEVTAEEFDFVVCGETCACEMGDAGRQARHLSHRYFPARGGGALPCGAISLAAAHKNWLTQVDRLDPSSCIRDICARAASTSVVDRNQ
jgi:ribosomal protein S27AE